MSSGVSLAERVRLAAETALRFEPDFSYRRRARALLAGLSLTKGDAVLDAGCGSGFYLRLLSDFPDLSVFGVDEDPKRVEAAQVASPRAVVQQADLAMLPFADHAFDAILCSEVLEHVEDPVRVLRELKRVLRPGGRLAISVPSAQYPFLWDPVNTVWNRWLRREPVRDGFWVGIWTGHRRLYEAKSLRDEVESAGLEVESEWGETHWTFPLTPFWVYGIGRRLVEHPRTRRWRWVREGDRFRGAKVGEPQWMKALLWPFAAVDALNSVRAGTASVNRILLARNSRS